MGKAKKKFDEVKNHSRTSQLKEISPTKQKTRPGMNYEWIGKNQLEKIRSKKSKKNQ